MLASQISHFTAVCAVGSTVISIAIPSCGPIGKRIIVASDIASVRIDVAHSLPVLLPRLEESRRGKQGA